MKADAITPGSCKLAPGYLVTVSIDLVDGHIRKMAAVQCDHVITTRQRLFYRQDGHDGCVSTPAVVVISIFLLYPALFLMLGLTKNLRASDSSAT